MNSQFAIQQDKPTSSMGSTILQPLRNFGSLLWRFSKKLMWFSSTSECSVLRVSVYNVVYPDSAGGAYGGESNFTEAGRARRRARGARKFPTFLIIIL